MINKLKILQFLVLLLLNSCIAQFIPQIEEENELLVVQGLLTDQPGTVSVRLSTSLPIGGESEAKPLTGCLVSITDDMGSNLVLEESLPGIYTTPYPGFVGRTYKLHIKTTGPGSKTSYESLPVKMKQVSSIDSLYYEKKIVAEANGFDKGIQECQIYLDTHDPDNNCRYYRWEYSETWVLRLLFDVPNQTCWISNNSKNIFLGNTINIKEDRISRLPVTYISNQTDRLRTKYSILVNQYSLNEDEYSYWEKLQKFIEQSGGLYDLIPSSVPGNIKCIEYPEDKVLGYFSVSALASKRIYIKDKFEGIVDDYADCISDTLIGDKGIQGLGISVWTLFDTPAVPFSSPRIRILTHKEGCADCTLRGTTQKPDFWIDD
jgi:hypothetical protein